MKKAILTILLTGLAAASPAPAAAGECRPVYYETVKLRTCEIDRCVQRRTVYDHCGYRTFYYVTTVTYRDYYSDGSTRTYSRSYRA